jgi:ankyrin repeat protein
MTSNTKRKRDRLALIAAEKAEAEAEAERIAAEAEAEAERIAAEKAEAKRIAECMPITQFYPVFSFLNDEETINYILVLLSNKVLRPKLHGLGITLFKIHPWETLHHAISAFMSLQFKSVISFNRYGNSINASEMILRKHLDYWSGEFTSLPYDFLHSIIKYMVRERYINPLCTHRTSKTILALTILANNGADVNEEYVSRDLVTVGHYKKWTPLIYAAYLGNIDIVKYLVGCGANVNPYPDVHHTNERTPLMYAALHCDIDMVKYLVEKGADVNVYSPDKDETVLKLALQSFRRPAIYDIVKYLAEKGADMNTCSRNLVMKSWMYSYRRLSLPYTGADMNTFYRNSLMKPWMYAVEQGSIDILKLIVTCLPDTCLPDTDPGTLSNLAVIKSNDNLEMIKYLVHIGAKFHIEIALLRASTYGHLELIKYLVNENNGILNHRTEFVHFDDSEYYHCLSTTREYNYVSWYIEDDLAVTYGEEALLKAAQNGYKDVVEYFINQKVNINARNCYGMTSLSLAVIHHHSGVAEYLLNKEALQVKDTLLKTPLVYAIYLNDLDMVKILIKNGAVMHDINLLVLFDISDSIFNYLKKEGIFKGSNC